MKMAKGLVLAARFSVTGRRRFSGVALRWIAIVISWAAVCLGHPAYGSMLAPLSAVGGYALFWWGVRGLPVSAIGLSAIWFALVNLFWLRWMGACIAAWPLAVLGAVILALVFGVQFGIFSRVVHTHLRRREGLSASVIVGLAALWVILEMSRIFLWSGFPVNGVGLCLLALSTSRKAAGFAGIHGLSFWVMVTNLTLLQLFCTRSFRSSWVLAFAVLALFPHFSAQLLPMRSEARGKWTIGIGATGWAPQVPPEKSSLPWQLLQKAKIDRPLDLLVLPEGFSPFSAQIGHWDRDFQGVRRFTTSHERAQSAARHHNCSLIMGMADEGANGSLQCAFFIDKEGTGAPRSYAKRILVPIGEYQPLMGPLQWQRGMSAWAEQWGFSSFRPGSQGVVFPLKNCTICPLICCEEAFSHIAEDGARCGADLFVGLSNDGWYPNSSLGAHHFWEAMGRSVEWGIPMVRSTNCGLSSAVTVDGEIALQRASSGPDQLDIYPVELTIATRWTPYRVLGFTGVGFLAALGVLVGFWRESRLWWCRAQKA